MVNDLNSFIHKYENVLEPKICKFLIDVFDKNEDKHEKINNNRKPNITQFNLTQNIKLSEEITNIHDYIVSKVFVYKKKYYKFAGENFFPDKFNLEEFRIKKYNNSGDEAFDTHVDVQDYSSARRFLSFLWYLNDVSNGGETVFNSLVIKPKVGTMIIFPPTWMFPHCGLAPISNNKYIMSTYLHYI